MTSKKSQQKSKKRDKNLISRKNSKKILTALLNLPQMPVFQEREMARAKERRSPSSAILPCGLYHTRKTQPFCLEE
jgi:hypothetical protein